MKIGIYRVDLWPESSSIRQRRQRVAERRSTSLRPRSLCDNYWLTKVADNISYNARPLILTGIGSSDTVKPRPIESMTSDVCSCGTKHNCYLAETTMTWAVSAVLFLEEVEEDLGLRIDQGPPHRTTSTTMYNIFRQIKYELYHVHRRMFRRNQ